MRVTVFCEGFDARVSEVPGHGIDFGFIEFSSGGEKETNFFIGYDKAVEIGKAIKFLSKKPSSVEEPF